MDQHSIASKRLMDQVIRSRNSYSSASSITTSSTISSNSSHLHHSMHSSAPIPVHQPTSSTVSSVVAQSGYHAVVHTHTVQNPQLLAQNKKRAAAERAAIQQKIKNHITKSQMEAKKQKDNHEKTRLWEDVILPHWNEYASSSKLRDLCVRGIPNKLRGRVWPLLVANELGIDEQMFETLCAEAQLLFHDKMTAARSRRKKAVNRESNAYGNQLHHGEAGTEEARTGAEHDHTGHHSAVDDIEEDEDPLDADYYPKQTYILDEDAAMALESEGPYLFHHQQTSHQSSQHPNSTATSNNYPSMAFGDDRRRFHSTGHASPIIGQAIPIPSRHSVLDVTEEDWFENERNGSLDEETFKIIQKQLFVKPVVIPGIPIPKHLQQPSTQQSSQQPAAPPPEPAAGPLRPKETQRNISREGNINKAPIQTQSTIEDSAFPAANNTRANVRRKSAPALQLQVPAKPSPAMVLFSPVPETAIATEGEEEEEEEPDSSAAMNNAIAGLKDEITSSMESRYDPNTDFLPFDFDDDDPSIRTPIKPTLTSIPRKHPSAGMVRTPEGSREVSPTPPNDIKAENDEENMHTPEPITLLAVDISTVPITNSTHGAVSAMTSQQPQQSQQQLISPIVVKPGTRGGSGHPSLARRTVLDLLNDNDEDDPFASKNEDESSRHGKGQHEDDNEDEEDEEEEEEEQHSILVPRLSRSSGAESAPIDRARLMSSDLHLVLSRPTSALDHVLQHQGESSSTVYSAAQTPLIGTHITQIHTGQGRVTPTDPNNSNSLAGGTPKQEGKLDPPNPKLERLLRVVSLIEWDLPRTFPTLAFFHDGGVMHTGLERILLCFALYCPEIGYVQGLSFLVAMLLLQCMDEYEVFVCLTNMILAPSRGNLQAFYRIQKSSIDGFVACFDYFFKKYLPLLHEHFQRESVESLMFLMDWHLSLFTKALPIEIAAKIWDVYLLEGEVYVLSVGLGILKMYAAKLATYSVEKISKFLLHLPDSIKTDELFTHIAQINITKKQYERIRKRTETNQTSPSHHLPTMPSAHTTSHPHHTPPNQSTESSGYFSASIIKSAVRSSLRVIRTAVGSTASHSTSPRGTNAHFMTPGQHRSPNDPIIHQRSMSVNQKSLSASSMTGYATSKSNHVGFRSSAMISTASDYAPFQSNRIEEERQNYRASDVEEVSHVLFNAGFLTLSPEIGNSSPVSQPSPGGLRRQVKSVSSLYDLEKNKLRQERELQRLLIQQQEEEQRIPKNNSKREVSLKLESSPVPLPDNSTGIQTTSESNTVTAASSLENGGKSPVPHRRMALGDDEGPSFVGTSLEEQSQYLGPLLTASFPRSSDRPSTPSQNLSQNPSIHTDRPTPIAPTRQHPRPVTRPSPPLNGNTANSSNTNSKAQRRHTTSSTSHKKKEGGGDCIPS